MWLALPALIIAASGASQETGEKRPRRDPQVEALSAEAASAPAEFAADILIRAAQSSRVTEPAWKRELLEDAFFRAYGAQQPHRWTATPVSPDTREGAQALAADTPMNRVTLQVRVADVMRVISAERAREMFGWIDVRHEASACETPLAPSLDEYYLALATMARQSFPDTVIGRGDGLQFLDLFLWNARLPSEMASVASAMRRLHAAHDEAAYLETLLRAILDNGERDPRGFSASALDIVSKIADLDNADMALGINGAYVLSALRRYLITQLNGPWCSDSTIEAPAIEMFNAIVRRRQAMWDGVPLITETDVRPSRMLAGVRPFPYWQTAETRRLHDEAIGLRGTGRQPVSIATRRTAGWIAQAERHLVNVQQWTGTREASERDYFYQKGVLFAGLLDLTVTEPTRTRAIRAFADFLHRSDAGNRRDLWFLFANRLFELMRSADSPTVLRALEDTGDQVLTLYAHAARVLAATRLTN
jgi:hypothetical protein